MRRFGIIQNNIALKRYFIDSSYQASFGIIQNNIALKHYHGLKFQLLRFGIIQNNIALKLPNLYCAVIWWFWNHSK